MPRKPLVRTHDFPYHVVARSNNKEWFYLPINECWDIFYFCLKKSQEKFKIKIFGFVLMSNHYHLLVQTETPYCLPKVMEWLQRSVNRKINDKAGRINHVFGGPYRPSLITDSSYFWNALKYIYLNPVRAGICDSPFGYKYSSLNSVQFSKLLSRTHFFEEHSLGKKREFIRFMNKPYSSEAYSELGKAMKRKTVEVSARSKKSVVLELNI